MTIDWEKHHVFMPFDGWCGPAVVKMIFSATGINIPIEEIADKIYKDWWGSAPVLIVAYLSQFFNVVNYKTNAKISDISFHIKNNHIVIVNWLDDNMGEEEGDGHYSVVASCEKGQITLVDPSGQREGIWSMSTKDFRERWFDYTDLNNRTYSEGFIIWVDPKSKR